MKKIYIFAAVLALLTLSLNAQQKGEEKTSQPKAPTEKSVSNKGSGSLRASTTPVTPPYVNEFNSQNDFNWWEVISDGYGNTWAYDSEGECASYTYSTYYAANDWLVTAPVYLEAGKNYTFSIDASAGNSSYPEQMEVKMATGHTANSLSSGTTVIASTTLTSTDYATFSNVVTVSQTGNYYFGIHATSPRDRAYLYVDNFSIKFTHDLAVYLSAPHTSNAGSTFTVVATVYNPGASAETGYTVNFTAGGTTISTQTANTSLAPGAVTAFTVEYSTNASDAGQTVNFGATVASTGDSNADNNTSTASTSLTSILPPPVNVQATGGEQSGTMTWNAPTITPESVTEDFEYTKDFPSFGLGGITSSVHTGAFGDWTLYDANGGNVYGSTEENFPNEYQPHAWFVFNPTMIGSGSTAHSGDQYVESVCPQGSSNNPANHWLISPELSGNAQTITFWDREFTTNYGDETFTVWVSTTDNNPSSFTQRVGNYTINYTDWQQRSISLPAGAKYFAIQHTSNNIFGMTIDDITYEAAPVNPVSYNVYLDGELVGNVNSNDPLTYTFNNVSVGDHQCAVSAVYPGGAESELVPATFTATPAVPVLTAPEDGTTIDVGTNSGLGVNKTIAVSGNYLTENLTVSVSGTGFRVSPTTLTAADVNAGTTITVTYTGTNPHATGTLTISSGEVSVTVNLTASYSTGIEPVVHGMVRMGTLPIVDQFAQKIPPTNDHPYRYTYFLKLATRDTTSSPARVPTQHTGAKIQGYYTQKQMDEDIDPTNFLETDMLSAELDMNLSPASAPYFYTINSVKNGVPNKADDYASYLSVLQRREAGDYQEMQDKYNKEIVNPHLYDTYSPGDFDFLDYRAVKANQKNDSLSFVPIVWTKGIDRYYYTSDSLHNSYGAPLWEVRTGDVIMAKPQFERQAKIVNGQVEWNPFVNWYDENNQACSLFAIKDLHATGVLPVGNIEYEPYMFRLWVYCDGLRNYTQNPNTGAAVNDTTSANRKSPRLLYTKYCNGADDLSLDIVKDNDNWDNNIYFGGLNTIKPKFVVRFYYVVKGYQKKVRGEEDEHVGYVAEGEGTPDDPFTAVYELSTDAEVVSQIFYNPQGMQSDCPFEGLNIVVTRYSDGTTKTTKMIMK
jgi:hypothetical protein